MSTYWTGSLDEVDDFGSPYDGVMYDLGSGKGQKYQKQPDGKWLKVDG